jgi:EAL domain-containing protein (putative c-di-GMP-specific phosphodiesterase class I)
VEDASEAESIALQILDGMNAPFSIGGVRVDIAATIGVSLYPQDGKDGQQLMRHADVAMHEAKKAAKRYAFYRREQDEDRAQRLTMVGELRRALEANELTLYYQPKVSMRDGRVCGAEALVRWIHPERGMLPPDEFISLAEYSGLIRPLTDWVIGAALRQSSLWRSKGLVLPVAVNLSAHNLRDGALVQKIEHLLAEWDAKPGWLELEITEGAMMEDPEGALDILKRLREMGILLFIDDFGTGYSSLGYLKKLPVDAVKIDKSFVIDMTEDPDSEVIVRTTISLGHELGLKVVAEGVENRTAFDRLATLNCDVAQGYFMSKPLPSEALELWMREGSWNPPDLKKQEKPRSRARVK